ncbi:MAG: WGxxGxxG-CTERM domain-containing protein [Verrucomicrobia bacterium]|nr:WGxxGxxG-CTERM domain-containing protein [Verrucomicrobiota bacterium]
MKTNLKKLCGALVCSTALLASSAFAQTYETDMARPGVQMTEPAGADRALGWSWLGLLGLLGLFGLKKPARHENEYRAPKTA